MNAIRTFWPGQWVMFAARLTSGPAPGAVGVVRGLKSYNGLRLYSIDWINQPGVVGLYRGRDLCPMFVQLGGRA